MLDILVHNDLFMACNKPAGMASQPDKTGDESLLELAEKRAGRSLHIVNRLDRPVSGIVLLAKTRAIMTELTEQFRQRAVEKTYLAVVQSAPPEEQGLLVHYLQKNQSKNMVFASPDEKPGAERAELEYRLMGKSERYFLLEIHPSTGKHHQIRAQLAAIGCPIKGDVKYGARRGNPDRSIHLHSWKIRFEHPRSGAPVELTAAPPREVIWDALAADLT